LSPGVTVKSSPSLSPAAESCTLLHAPKVVVHLLLRERDNKREEMMCMIEWRVVMHWRHIFTL
jgi:hypothetical protein